MMIFREVKRILKREGAFWLNIGDTYSSHAGGQNSSHNFRSIDTIQREGIGILQQRISLAEKCMVCIPERVMFAMISDGWLLRNKCIWRKPNSMPGSQKDRFTTSWEYLYFFVKNTTTCLWRNRQTGEWRDTRPSKEEKYPWGGMYCNPETEEFSWKKLKGYVKLMPLWMGFDYYFDLDQVRVPHKTQSLERYQRQVNFGDRTPQSKYADTNPYPEGTQPIYREGRNLCPDWFKEMFPEDKDYKGKFDQMFESGSNTGEHNKEPYVEEYDYPEKPEKTGKGKQYRRLIIGSTELSDDEKQNALRDLESVIERVKCGQILDFRMTIRGEQRRKNTGFPTPGGRDAQLDEKGFTIIEWGGNTSLGKHHGSSHDGRAGFDREARDRPLIAPHYRDSGDGWEKQAIEGREPKTKHDQAVGRTGNVSYTDPLHTKDYSPKGKNPSDTIELSSDISKETISLLEFPFQTDTLTVPVDVFQNLQNFLRIVVNQLINSARAVQLGSDLANFDSFSKVLTDTFQHIFSSTPMASNFAVIGGNPYTTITVKQASNKMTLIFGSHWWEVYPEGLFGTDTQQSQISRHSFAINLNAITMPFPPFFLFFGDWHSGLPSFLNKLNELQVFADKSNSGISPNGISHNTTIRSDKSQDISHFGSPVSKVVLFQRMFGLITESAFHGKNNSYEDIIIPIEFWQEQTEQIALDFWEITTQPSSISVCPECETVFRRMIKKCPNCGHKGVTGHFAPYPEALCDMPIRASSRPGDIVLDPFCGGGTTLVVAKKLGRRTTGIDVVKEYCIMAKHRVLQVEYQPSLDL